MSQVLIIKPFSKDVNWLLKLQINDRKNRVTTCFRKIDRLFSASRKGDVASIIELHEWYKVIRQTEGYFDKEIVRLTKLIRRRVKDKFEYQPYTNKSYRVPVSTVISAALYRIITKLDTLMCLSETCLTLQIFKKRRLFSNVIARYKKPVISVVSRISKYKIMREEGEYAKIENHKEILALAMQSDVMPEFDKKTIIQLKSIVDPLKDNKTKENHIAKNVQA